MPNLVIYREPVLVITVTIIIIIVCLFCTSVDSESPANIIPMCLDCWSRHRWQIKKPWTLKRQRSPLIKVSDVDFECINGFVLTSWFHRWLVVRNGRAAGCLLVVVRPRDSIAISMLAVIFGLSGNHIAPLARPERWLRTMVACWAATSILSLALVHLDEC